MIVLPEDMAKSLEGNSFDALMNLQGQVYRKQPLRETARVIIQNKPYFIKKHYGITLSECLKNIFSGRLPIIGAKPEWKAIRAAEKLGISTTPLVAYGERGAWPLTRESFILTQSLERTESLETYRPDFAEKQTLIQDIANITRLLHTNGWVHRDLYLCHFLRNQKGALSLIDLHRMTQPKFFKKRWVQKDLAGLLFSALEADITQRDVLRFLKAYKQAPLRSFLEQEKTFFDQVVTKARHLYVKSYQKLPVHKWMLSGCANLPLQPGECSTALMLAGSPFKADYAYRVLKDRRWVMRGHWKGQEVVLKLFSRESEYKCELQGAHLLAQHDIAAPAIHYDGKIDSLAPEHGYAIVYEYLDQAKPINQITPELLAAIKKMHDANLLQTDCHKDNFLQKADKIYVLDAGSVHHEADNRLGNLALLFAQWPATQNPSHLALLHHYSNEADLKDRLPTMIEARRIQGRETWLKKIFRNCSAVRCKTRLTHRMCVARDFDSLATQTLLAYPEAYFHHDAHYLKKGNSATVIRETLGGQDIVIKRFNRKNGWIRLKRYVTPSKAARAWKMAHAMESIGIVTPRPLAFIEKRFGPFRLDSYYVCAFTPGERLDRLDSLEPCQTALDDMMAALNHAKCQHGDLKASNILWDGTQLILLDTDAAKLYKNSQKFKSAHAADRARLKRNWEKS